MTTATSHELRFRFQLIPMRPAPRFETAPVNQRWHPPRPKHSNVVDPNNAQQPWYQYNNGTTTLTHAPDENIVEHYKTYSFYFDDGRFWIYPCNAIRYKVGNGSHPQDSTLEETDSSSGESDATDPYHDPDNDDRAFEDWKDLTFGWNAGSDNSATSFATTRAENDVLQCQRPNQPWRHEVLPDRYFAPLQRTTTAPEWGGLLAEIPILIALIVFSVPTNLVHSALLHCFRRTYRAHNQPRGRGWTNRRGVVVRVYSEKVPQPGSGTEGVSQELSIATRRMAWFERGLHGFLNFFP